MPISVKKVKLWRTEVENKPGALSGVLAPLAEVGVDLQVVMGYRYHDEEDKAAVEICTVSGRKPALAASKAGLVASTIPTLLVHGDNSPGVGHAIAEAISVAGINVTFLVAQVVEARFSAVMGFETEEASKQATTLIKKAVKKFEQQAGAAARDADSTDEEPVRPVGSWCSAERSAMPRWRRFAATTRRKNKAGSRKVCPPNIPLGDHHWLCSKRRLAAAEANSSVPSPTSEQTRSKASVTYSGACRATYSARARL